MYKKKGKKTSSDTSLNFNTLQRPKEHRILTTSASTSSSTLASSTATSVSTSASLFASISSTLALSKTVTSQNKKRNDNLPKEPQVIIPKKPQVIIPKEPQVIIEPTPLTTTTRKTAISEISSL
ncbi:2249_t:CDS:2 [Dentiscutata heterogama]|uniref:2249_t:CDS:1 n=1 Tax=Dentiscutata heterogama TaxID=1316150 RepID=A0ACA9PBN2_9GLOM|nr:2249_t:CDS:2 [Dentiscutata heterogama]